MLYFDKFITPSLVQAIYMVGLSFIVIGAFSIGPLFLSNAGGGKTNILYFVLISIILGVVVTVIGGTIWRIVCEFIILAFKMFERMTEIRDRLPPL